MNINYLIGTCNDQDSEPTLRSVIRQVSPNSLVYLVDDFSEQEKIDRLFCVYRNLVLIQHKLTNDMAEQVNYALRLVPNDCWTCYLDGDELVGPQFSEGISEELFKANNKPTLLSQYFAHTLWGEKPGDVWGGPIAHCQKGYTFQAPELDLARLIVDPTYPTEAGLQVWGDCRVRVWINKPDTFFSGVVHKMINKPTEWICNNPKTVIQHHKHICRFAKRNPFYERLEREAKQN